MLDVDVSSRAMLVATKVRLWSGEKRDKRLSRELCDMTQAETNAIRANKSLLGDAIGPVQAAERAVRQEVNDRTLPWMDDGTRILKGSAFLPFTEAVNAKVRAFDAAVAQFVDDYPAVKEQARARLGQAYEDRDFPSQSRLAERFGVKLTFLPIPSGDDFRIALGQDEIAAVRRNAEDAVRESVQEAVRNLLDRLREPVARLSSRLRLMRRTGRGKIEHPFRDTIIENVRAVVALAPTLNLMDDPRITALCGDIERLLTAHHPDQLRASPSLRTKVANDADDILRRLEGAY